jgi:glycosyltransferase involved in cell wall biosynthesis
MSHQNLYSVIVPTFNRADRIRMTLDSIQAQTYGDWECIVADDGSTDRTREVVEEYRREDPRFIFCERPPDRPKGPSAARNHGLSLARGRYVHFFDSDDRMKPELMENVVRRFEEDDAPDLVFMAFERCTFENGQPVVWGTSDPEFSREAAFEELVTKKYFVQTNSGVWRKSWLDEQDEVFNESISKAEDYELFGRFLAPGNSFACLHQRLYQLVGSEDSLVIQHRSGDRKLSADHMVARINLWKVGNKHGKLSPAIADYLAEFAWHELRAALRARTIGCILRCFQLLLLCRAWKWTNPGNMPKSC